MAAKKNAPLDHRTVNIVTPDRGIGPNTITLVLSHPTKGEAQLIKDTKEIWGKQEEEEWESDDVLEDKLKELGYISHDIGKVVHIEL